MDALHRHILDHQSTAVVLLDDTLRVTFLNQAAEYLLAGSNDRSRGDELKTLMQDGETFEEELLTALRDNQSYTKRHTVLRAPLLGQELTVDLTVTPVDQEDFRGVLMELQPLDRLLRINREAAQLMVQQTTRQLVRGLAHEIKNPLGGIRGAAQLLSRELDNPSLDDFTEVIIDEADRLRNLVDRMLGPNQLPKPEPANVHRLLERVRALLDAEQQGRIRFVRDYDPSIPDLVCDQEQMVQAFLNVSRNAVQALEDVPEPVIELRTRTLRQYTIGDVRHRLVLRIDVIDNGPGIPPELVDRLFYPMISGRAGGTGLGLSISQAIISQHGGLIECESAPGCTRFSFLLPLDVGSMEHSHEAA